jgi:hypothetical protein
MFSPNEKFYRHDQGRISDALGIKRADLGIETKDILMIEGSVSESIAEAIRRAKDVEEACYMSFVIGRVNSDFAFAKGIGIGSLIVGIIAVVIMVVL